SLDPCTTPVEPCTLCLVPCSASSQYPFLHALPVMLLAGIQGAVRVDGDGADGEQLTRQPSTASEAAHLRERVALQHDDFLVVTVGDVHVSLLRIVRKGKVPDRAP